MASGTVRIATRASRLALWQAHYVRDLLLASHPGLQAELVEIVSTGDAVRDRPLFEIGGVGVFTKEVQDAVLANQADLAVHSLKDLPTQSHPDLVLAAVPARETVDDVLLAPAFKTLDKLPEGATVATSSLRRRSQLLRLRPDLKIVDVRGNVETRVKKLHDGEFDAMVLAAAGLKRLGLEKEASQRLDHAVMLPAVGQGALGLECRSADAATREILMALQDGAARDCVESERAFLRELQGGCHVPVAAHAVIDGETLLLQGRVLSVDGGVCIEGEISGPPKDAVELGTELASRLIDQGAREILFPG